MRAAVMMPLFMIICVAILFEVMMLESTADYLGGLNGTIANPLAGFAEPFGGLAAVTFLGFPIAFSVGAMALTLIIASFAIVLVAGIQFSGSLSPEIFGFSLGSVGAGWEMPAGGAQMVVYGCIFYGTWFLFSALAAPMIFAIPFFGVPLYFTLTLIYTFGVFEEMRG